MKRCHGGALLRHIVVPCMIALFLAPQAWGATYTVNTTNDVGDAAPGDGICETANGNAVCSLRAAFQEVGFATSKTIIFLPSGTYKLTIVLDGLLGARASGPLDGDFVELIGAGADTTVIDAGSLYPVFSSIGFTRRGPSLIRDITLRNGNGDGRFGAAGGLSNEGELTLENVIVSGNTGESGGIRNFGTLTIVNSTITGNTSTINRPTGAGIFNQGKLVVRNSTLSDNRALFDPQAIPVFNEGAAIFNFGSMQLTNVTISDHQGGAIYSLSRDDSLLTNVTITNSRSAVPGGAAFTVAEFRDINSQDVTGRHVIKNSILDNETDLECRGVVISQGYNLTGDSSDSCGFAADATSRTGVDPMLGDLRANGGPTATRALLVGSPAINAGDPAGCTDTAGPVLKDQRNGVRSVGGRCDIGAYEFGTPVAVAGLDRRVLRGATVRLDGSGSTVNEGGAPGFRWTQLSGTAVALNDADTATPTFTAPADSGTLVFQLAVTNGFERPPTNISDDTITVTIAAPPLADAGGDLTAKASEFVSLNGAGSSDPDGSRLSYSWVQTAGIPVVLSGAQTPNPSFVSPDTATTLTFQLTVTDGDGEVSTSSVTVNVSPPPNMVANKRGGGGGGAMNWSALALLGMVALAVRRRRIPLLR